MSGWVGLRKRSKVPVAYHPLIGLTPAAAKDYLAANEVIGQGTGGGMRLKTLSVVDLDDTREHVGSTLVWNVDNLTVYVEDGVVVDVGDVG